jgi:hypothetical protein
LIDSAVCVNSLLRSASNNTKTVPSTFCSNWLVKDDAKIAVLTGVAVCVNSAEIVARGITGARSG